MADQMQTAPPQVPAPRSGWPVRRTPKWLLAALGVLVVIGVAVALVHKPSQAERASDLRGFLHDMTTDIQSCAGGVRESLTALHGIESGASDTAANVNDTISIATYGAGNCSPANSMPLDDLDQYQVTESLASFHLGVVVTDLVAWAAPDAINVQTDVANVLSAKSPQAKTRANTALQRALRKLNAQRAAIDARLDHAISALHAHASPPSLPG
jgi:hypothetical protein